MIDDFRKLQRRASPLQEGTLVLIQDVRRSGDGKRSGAVGPPIECVPLFAALRQWAAFDRREGLPAEAEYLLGTPSLDLPNSREVVAGDYITLDKTVPGELRVSAEAGARVRAGFLHTTHLTADQRDIVLPAAALSDGVIGLQISGVGTFDRVALGDPVEEGQFRYDPATQTVTHGCSDVEAGDWAYVWYELEYTTTPTGPPVIVPRKYMERWSFSGNFYPDEVLLEGLEQVAFVIRAGAPESYFWLKVPPTTATRAFRYYLGATMIIEAAFAPFYVGYPQDPASGNYTPTALTVPLDDFHCPAWTPQKWVAAGSDASAANFFCGLMQYLE